MGRSSIPSITSVEPTEGSPQSRLMSESPAITEVQPSLIEAVRRHASDAAFGRPLVQNNLRAMVVEAIVDLALPEGWRWSSADWAGWDFEHADGTRLEVKQSAARQTWAAPRNPAQRRFDVALRQGRWEGSVWVDEPGRHAHLYLLADHPIIDDTADHRDPSQWVFYPLATSALPMTKTVSLNRVCLLTAPCRHDELAARVEQLRLFFRFREGGHATSA